jgi:hypothetical protein
MVEMGGWKKASRRVFALVATVMVVVVAIAPADGAGAGTRPRPTYWTSIEWPQVVGVTLPRCVSDFAKATAYHSPVWGEPTEATISISHSGTGEPGCKPVRESRIEGSLRATTFWVTPDQERGRLVASGWVPCAGAGCPGRYVKVHVDAWIRHDPTSTTAPGGAIAWGTITVNGCVVMRGWSENSETNLVYGPID